MRLIPDRPRPTGCRDPRCPGSELEAYRADPLERGFIAYYRCYICGRSSRHMEADFVRLIGEDIPAHGQFFTGPYLLGTSPLEKRIQVRKCFNPPALWTAVANNPDKFHVRRLGATKRREGYMIIRDATTWWRGRGFQFDALWAFWCGT